MDPASSDPAGFTFAPSGAHPFESVRAAVAQGILSPEDGRAFIMAAQERDRLALRRLEAMMGEAAGAGQDSLPITRLRGMLMAAGHETMPDYGG